MKNRTSYKWLSIFLVMLLMILAGCQSVNGLDLNKMFQNGVKIKSSQGSSTLTLELIRNPQVTPSENEQRILDLFSSVKVNLTEMKQQDMTHLSMKGTFEYAKGKIPFQFTLSEQDYTFMIEGAKKPIVIHNDPFANSGSDVAPSKEMQDQIKQLYAKSAELTPAFITFLTNNAPNPGNISVSDARENIHNEGLNLKKVHAEIMGSELVDLFKGFITNVVADEKGLKELIGQVYDVVAPIAAQAIKDAGSQTGTENPMADMVTPYLNNKTLAVEFAFTFLNSNLKKMLADYDANVAKAKADESFNELLSDRQSLKVDVYVDSDLTPRKSNVELTLNLSDKATEAVQGFKLTSTSESWGINQPVKSDVIDTNAGVLELNSMSKPGKVLSNLDPKSQLYTLLKNDLQITKKNIQMIVDNEDSYQASSKPYNSNGTIMVPVRFVVEQLDADVTWDQPTQQVTITDWVSGAVIKLNIGSKQATVNGMIKPLETEVELKNGSTFVPVRFIAESMGALVDWDQEKQMVSISRD